MKKGSRLLEKLAHSLFSEAADRQHFAMAVQAPHPHPPAILWLRDRPLDFSLQPLPALPFQPAFVDRIESGTRPGSLPEHDAGYYYCLDFSSVFACCVLSAVASEAVQSLPVLDMCASPGGKSVFTWRHLKPCSLLCNEVIGKRSAQLIANLKRCRIHPVKVFRLDSAVLAESAPGSCALVLVDAPCSGQSLLVKGMRAPGCFHPTLINMNSNRQKRIIANSAALLAPGGFLAYMTCTYAREENEAVVEWLLRKMCHLSAVQVPDLTAYQSHLSDIPCYRLWPQSGVGAGAFAALLRNETSGSPRGSTEGDLPVIWRSADFRSME